MVITVKLFATLRDFGKNVQDVNVSEGTRLIDVIGHFKIPSDTPMIKLVNGEFAELEHILKDGDVLALFPPIAGG